jgi:hypothetical protein
MIDVILCQIYIILTLEEGQFDPKRVDDIF